jgi:nicotinate phosphoribosyltransferase
VAGASATSLVAAGQRFGLALSGTMAHSYVMAHGDEGDAFTSFLERFGERSVLLVDTYDTLEGTRRAVEAMDATGIVASGIRIDSGDLGALAVAARRILDEGGYPGVLLSGDLDEHRIAALLAEGAPVDAFGVGTRMGTSADAPYLGVVYKLVCQAGEPRMKLSPGKQTLPGRKQVWRSPGQDLIAVEHEPGPPGARPLLSTVMDGGRRTAPPEPLSAARDRCLAALVAWSGQPPAITASTALQELRDEAERVLTAED